MAKIAIIGGSGLDDPQILQGASEQVLSTKWGAPSSALSCGKIGGTEVVILARHGKNHTTAPSMVNYRANIQALKDVGCTHILATTAVGSLRSEIPPGHLAFPAQFIDFTKQRVGTFFQDSVVHSSMADPFNRQLRDLLCTTADELGLAYRREVTIITIEGPRFSTRAESHLFRAWGADIINMSSCPEVALANEIGLPYQAIAMSTDYDCWKDEEEPVSFEMVMRRMAENADKVKRLLLAAVGRIR